MHQKADSRRKCVSFLLLCSEKIKELIDQDFVKIANVQWTKHLNTTISNDIPQNKIMSDYQHNSAMLNMWAREIKSEFLKKHKAILKDYPFRPEWRVVDQWFLRTIGSHFYWAIAERQLTLARIMRDLFREQLTTNSMSDWMKEQNRHFSSVDGNEFDVRVFSDYELQQHITTNVPQDKLIDTDFLKITNEKYQREITRFLNEHTSICHYFGITEITLSREFLVAYNPIEVIEEYGRTAKAALEAKQNEFNEKFIRKLTIEPTNVFSLVVQTVSSSRFFSKNRPETGCTKIEMQPLVTPKMKTLT